MKVLLSASAMSMPPFSNRDLASDFQPTRRRVLQTLLVTAAAVPFASAWGEDVEMRVDVDAFPQSVASGDPKPNQVIVWTRLAPQMMHAGSQQALRLQVAEDEAFTKMLVDRTVHAQAASDGCVRVRVDGLKPHRHHYYRFVLAREGKRLSSPVGRTKTAPAADQDVPVRFAMMSCQDYSGRYYNSLLPLLDEDVDFLLHLGDFIYESVGDPEFQEQDGKRSIAFDDQAGAFSIGTGEKAYFVAQSVDNYRQLHRTFRSDAVLKQLLQRHPLVAIWDDHEFSDDCWQDHATYQNERFSERQPVRRRNAEQAYFEYMPIDVPVYGENEQVVAQKLFPNTRLYRTLDFGKQVRLVLTDFRSFRPDHPIAEDAFPGGLAYDQPALQKLLPNIGQSFEAMRQHLFPYVDLRDEAYDHWQTPARRALKSVFEKAGIDEDDAQARAETLSKQPIALMVLTKLLEGYNEAVPWLFETSLPDPEADYPRGLPWFALGKGEFFSHIGSRYFVVKSTYDLFMALRNAESAQPSAWGETQAAWLKEQVAESPARWTMIASSVSMTPMVLDLSRKSLNAPAIMQRAFYLNVDQWDGFPQERDAWVDAFDQHGGAVVLSGDIHASFVSQLGEKSLSITTPAVSSKTLRDIMSVSVENGAEDQREAGQRMLAELDDLLLTGDARNLLADTGRHGFVMLDVDKQQMSATFSTVPSDTTQTNHYADRQRFVDQHVTKQTFVAPHTTRSIERKDSAD